MYKYTFWHFLPFANMVIKHIHTARDEENICGQAHLENLDLVLSE